MTICDSDDQLDLILQLRAQARHGADQAAGADARVPRQRVAREFSAATPRSKTSACSETLPAVS
jgi:hypothetical protein